MNALHEASEAAKTAWMDAMTADPPVGLEKRLDAVLDAYTASLAAAGCLVLPELAPTQDELNQAAKWLAEQSQFIRYWGGADKGGEPLTNGWKLLRTHPRDVEVAYAKAKAQLTPGEHDSLNKLSIYRRILIATTENAARSH